MNHRVSLLLISNTVLTTIGRREKFVFSKVGSICFFFSGFDIGNHFCEFTFDYQSAKEWPFYKVHFQSYPNGKQQRNFLKSYADALISNQDESIDDEIPIDRDELIEHLMKEANYFALASHFFWALWAINMAISTTIPFGYMVTKTKPIRSDSLMCFFSLSFRNMHELV